jgi:hypothetical protein
MSSIIRNGDTYHGISVFGRGVFTNKNGDDWTYAGQCKDGYACGLGVATRSYGNKEYDKYGPDGQFDGRYTHFIGYKEYAEHGPDGQFDGRYLWRLPLGPYRLYLRNIREGTRYRLYEHGKSKDSAFVDAYGRCKYNGEDCAPDDPRLLALIAQVAPVEVHPAAPAPHPPLARQSPPSNRPMDRPARFALAGAGDLRGHRGAPPRRTPSLVVARHSPTAATLQSTSTQ